MTKRMLIDTTHAEETRVVVMDGNRLDDYDVETSAKRQLKGNIYLAKIVRIEPSLQAAFVEYGGNRHGFLAFAEIHPDYYQIPVADRERLIALQEEEALAEEARADRDEDDDRGGPADHVVETTARSLPDDAMPDDAMPDEGGAEGDAGGQATGEKALEMPAETVQADAEAGADGAEDAPSDERDAESDAAEPDGPAPETVGGETVDDGHAQRRTARFLRQYKIQEVMRRRQILLIQVVKEERGNKGAALTTYISLAGRFCVLMPNSMRGGGVSRKITSAADRRRLKEITAELEIPRGMAMIVRTAGAQRPRPEIRRDCEYLLRTWDDIRETTMQSIAPCLVYEEASLIKRAIRDVYTRDIEEIVVDGEPGWKGAREFMRTLMPANAGRVNLWRGAGGEAGAQTLFSHYQVEHHLDAMLQPSVQLRSGGTLVINQTEALVAIDVNSGRSTRERSVEETALRTNMEAADEVARQLRLRDLAGLIVIDFIDMDVRRHNAMVERRLKDALRNDRARIQVGTISHFGLMEMSRQRLRPSLAESSFVACSHCAGSGFMRGTESSALHVLRAIEEEAGRRKAGEIVVHVAAAVALYVLNNKRAWLQEIEARHHLAVRLAVDDALMPPALRIEKTRPYVGPQAPVADVAAVAAPVTRIPIEAMPPASDDGDEAYGDEPVADRGEPSPPSREAAAAGADDGERRGKRRRRRRRGGRREDGSPMPEDGAPAGTEAGAGEDMGHSRPEPGDEFDEDERPGAAPPAAPVAGTEERAADAEADRSPEQAGRGRRRRGGRNRRGAEGGQGNTVAGPDEAGVPDPLEAPRLPAPRPYSGPTPADPFAGSFDIFEMMEREADETPPLAREPSASAASLAPPVPEPIAEGVAEAETGPVMATALPAAEPVEAETDVASAGDQEAAREPVPESVAAEPAEAAQAVAAKAKRPRAPRIRKAAAGDATAVEAEATAPAAVPAAVPADAPPPKPARARSARPKRKAADAAPDAAVEPATEAARAEPVLDAVAPAPEPEPEPDAAQPPLPEVEAPALEAAATPPGGPDPSIVQPVVIDGAAPAAARRTGWWKR